MAVILTVIFKVLFAVIGDLLLSFVYCHLDNLLLPTWLNNSNSIG